MAQPVFLPRFPSKDATPWTILSWGSALLHGFTRSPRPRPLSREQPLLGFHAPSAHTGGESPRPPGCPVRLPGFAGNPPAGPTPPATVPLTGFLSPSAAFFLSPPSYHFQAGGARGVHPSGDCPFHRSPRTRRPRLTLMTLFPRLARTPDLGGSVRRHTDRNLGCPGAVPLSSTGSSSR